MDVHCTRIMSQYIAQLGGKVYLSACGSERVWNKMKETGAFLGITYDGFVFLKDRWFGYDDGLYAACRILSTISHQPLALSQLLHTIPVEALSTQQMSIELERNNAAVVIAGMQEIVRQRLRKGELLIDQLVDVDGVRLEFEYGWGCVRQSLESQSLLCRFEANSKEQLLHIQDLFRKLLLAVDSELQIPF